MPRYYNITGNEPNTGPAAKRKDQINLSHCLSCRTPRMHSISYEQLCFVRYDTTYIDLKNPMAVRINAAIKQP